MSIADEKFIAPFRNPLAENHISSKQAIEKFFAHIFFDISWLT